MSSKKGFGLLLASGLAIAACSTFKSSDSPREIASVESWAPYRAQILKSDDIAKLSSGGKLELTNAELIIDNNRAFQKKREMVKEANRELRMVYYIWSDDYSSSVFNSEVLARARKGVQVKILVDFITNYERLDLFEYLERAGQGNIKVKFYGLPTEEIMKAAVYATTPCGTYEKPLSDQCKTEKVAYLNQIGNPKMTWFSQMFLSGMYGKNGGLLKVAAGIGGGIDPANYKKGPPPTPKQIAQLKAFASLLVKSELKGDVAAKLKVQLALTNYGDELNPIMNELTGRLPLHLEGGKDWDHLTDYTHHKLLVADYGSFMLGGRNIEDSYHTEVITKTVNHPGDKMKYTFMDSDFYAASPDTKEVADAFDRLFEFSPMVGDLKRVRELVPNEYDTNPDQFKQAVGACLQDRVVAVPDLENCVNTKMTAMPGYRKLETRLEEIRRQMSDRIEKYAKYSNNSVKQWKSSGDQLDAADLKAEAYYIENVSFKKSAPKKRIFGSKIGEESDNGKYIHALWAKGLENTCAVSAESKKQTRVVIHSAYVFFSSNLVNALGSMLNGRWNCRYVDVVILTNAIETTDLFPINIFARYQLNGIISYSNLVEQQANLNKTANENKATLKYYEYKAQNAADLHSLHTKISVLGNDMIIGSANADVRSYAMDTNNGVYIRNAMSMVSDYNQYIDHLIADGEVVDKTSGFVGYDTTEFQRENLRTADYAISKWPSAAKLLQGDRKKNLLERVHEIGINIRTTTADIIKVHEEIRNNNDVNSAPQVSELDKKANKFDSTWKPF